MSAVTKRSIVVSGHPTSVSLEPEFWDALKSLAKERGQSMAQLIAAVDETRDGNLSSALRVFVLENIRRPPQHGPD